jgi:hypothetical protein
VFLFHSRRKTSNAQRPTSNAELQSDFEIERSRLGGVRRSLTSALGTCKKVARPHFLKNSETFPIGSGENK